MPAVFFIIFDNLRFPNVQRSSRIQFPSAYKRAIPAWLLVTLELALLAHIVSERSMRVDQACYELRLSKVCCLLRHLKRPVYLPFVQLTTTLSMFAQKDIFLALAHAEGGVKTAVGLCSGRARLSLSSLGGWAVRRNLKLNKPHRRNA